MIAHLKNANKVIFTYFYPYPVLMIFQAHKPYQMKKLLDWSKLKSFAHKKIRIAKNKRF